MEKRSREDLLSDMAAVGSGQFILVKRSNEWDEVLVCAAVDSLAPLGSQWICRTTESDGLTQMWVGIILTIRNFRMLAMAGVQLLRSRAGIPMVCASRTAIS